MDFDFTPAGLMAGMVVSSVGFGVYLYGKRQGRLPQLVAGGAMMVYPMFVTGAGLCMGIAGVLTGALWLALRAGL